LIEFAPPRQLKRWIASLKMEREQWRHVWLYTLVGLALTFPFFAISVVTLYHLDLEVVDLLFPYAVIANPYYPFRGLGWLLTAIQWPAYGFVAGFASALRGSNLRRMTKPLLALLFSLHIVVTGVAYYRRAHRTLGGSRMVKAQSNNSLDRSGGSVFFKMNGPAKGE
jgi:hypothetical protein